MKKRFLLFLFALLWGCEKSPESEQNLIQCDPDNGGLILPDGFCALIVADHISFLRHITITQNGDIYGSRRSRRLELGGLVGIRDSDGDGRADIVQEFGDKPTLGIAVHENSLYFGENHRILKYALDSADIVPPTEPEIVVDNFPDQKVHAGKTFAIDEQSQIYINLGSPSNACQEEELIPASKGIDPCPHLEQQAAIWRFNGKLTDQQFPADGVKYASGVRNAYAIDWKPDNQTLYVIQHGRDGLFDLWPEIYEAQQGAELPAEEFLMIQENDVFGWPYCYHDQNKKLMMLAPEYGGDGLETGRCDKYKNPIFAFPAHYSPNDLLFYSGEQFPPQYRKGAFIAFHGSYNRGPFEQVGYQVVYVPFKDGLPTGKSQVFADGFSGYEAIKAPEDAEFRPVGLAEGPDGSLYIADSVQGRIWRVLYQDQEVTE